MVKTKNLKRIQVQGKKYDLPDEEVNIQKLVTKGVNINNKLKKLKQDLEIVKNQLILIAEGRRKGATTVQLQAVSGSSTVTFRENYVCDDNVEEISQELGSLFERFFKKKIDFKTTKNLKQFLDGVYNHGIENSEVLRELILTHVHKKTIKPNVKITGIE